MRNYINVERIPDKVFLGYVRENNARGVTIDWTAWADKYGPGTMTVLLLRSGDAEPYEALTATGTGPAVWKPTATDTAKEGGEMQLVYTVGAMIRKSPVMSVEFGESLPEEL